MDLVKTTVRDSQVNRDKVKIDQIVRTFFMAFANINKVKVDLNVLRQLFIDQAIIIKNCDQPEVYNLQQFIEPRQKLLNDGVLINFCEKELTESTEIFGNIAQRFCSYQKTGVLAGKAFDTRGVKTMQFIRTGDDWKISALAWDDE